MNIYTQKQRWKIILLLAAMLIGIVSLWYTNRLVKVLQDEEKKKIELWAESMRLISKVDVNSGDLTLTLDVIKSNETIPVIITDEEFNITSYINIDSLKAETDTGYLNRMMEEMKAQHSPIISQYDRDARNYVFYKDSEILNKLRYYPYFQLGIIALFLMVSYLAFSTSRKAEQNQVWVGMAKETAHQLGTPLSSLGAWTDYLKTKYPADTNISEMDKDISRLNTITERFSKIGSAPALKRENLVEVIQNSINYIKSRTSQKVTMSVKNLQNHEILAPLNTPLFEWVLENIFKNAIDAMAGRCGVVA